MRRFFQTSQRPAQCFDPRVYAPKMSLRRARSPRPRSERLAACPSPAPMRTVTVSVHAPHIRTCGKHHVSAELDAASAPTLPTIGAASRRPPTVPRRPRHHPLAPLFSLLIHRTKWPRRCGPVSDVQAVAPPNYTPRDGYPYRWQSATRALYPSSAQGRSIPAVLIRLPSSSAAPLVFSPTPSSQAPRQPKSSKHKSSRSIFASALFVCLLSQSTFPHMPAR
ncbi:hypothetical protein DFH06DRAFT_672552 [Mycena polygramma]|nr:hypothetical protein DFH06DRAFT_672552 [Mycena polygramma]